MFTHKIKGYALLYSDLVDAFSQHNKRNKIRLLHKHCKMAEKAVLKKFPNMKPMVKGEKAYTYRVGAECYFTCRPEQKKCVCYTVYKIMLVCKQEMRKFF